MGTRINENSHMSAKIYVKKTKHQHLGAAASPLGFSFGMDSWCRFPPLSGSPAPSPPYPMATSFLERHPSGRAPC